MPLLFLEKIGFGAKLRAIEGGACPEWTAAQGKMRWFIFCLKLCRFDPISVSD